MSILYILDWIPAFAGMRQMEDLHEYIYSKLQEKIILTYNSRIIIFDILTTTFFTIAMLLEMQWHYG